jgi:choline-sulfatase
MSETPPVVFVVLDGTRKDRLSLYGHDRETSPNLDALASDAVVFENAYTPASWSLPAHTSMFSGLYPSEHGINNVFSGEPFGSPETLETLSTELSAAGYRTGGFSANPWLGKNSGLDTGFDLFVEWDLELSTVPEDWSTTQRDRLFSTLHSVLGKASQQPLALLKDDFFTDRLFDTAVRWITDDAVPAYSFLNVMGSHTPYYPSRDAFEDLDLERPSLLEPRLLNAKIVKDQLQGEGTAVSNTERIREYYDSTIRSQDERLGTFLDRLRANGVYDDALIIVTADHGKTLGEFDRNADPSHTLRDINVNVPLVVKFPEQRHHQRVSDPFEMVNIGEFVFADDPHPTLGESATSQYALVEDYVPHTADEPKEVTQWRALTDGQTKYVVDDSGTEYLLEGTGPAESLITDRPRLEEMRAAMETKLSSLDSGEPAGTQETAELDEEVKSQLKDIGYLG